MNDFISKNNPSNGDVLVIVSEASLSSMRTDLKRDIISFLDAGTNVSIALTSGPRSLDTGDVTELLDFALRTGCRFLGNGDVFLSTTTLVYSTNDLLDQGVEVQFSTEQIAYLIDDLDWFRNDTVLERILANSATYGSQSTIFLGASNEDLKAIRTHASGYPCALWNFLNSDAREHAPHMARHTNEYWLGSTFDEANKELSVDLKKISNGIANSPEARLALRTALPSRLENPRGDSEVTIGYPFVPSNEEDFIASLSAYILPSSGLKSKGWKSEVSTCLKYEIPLFLPEVLRPIVEDRAHYFEGKIDSVLLGDIVAGKFLDDSGKQDSGRKSNESLNNFQTVCDLLGVTSGGATSVDNHNRGLTSRRTMNRKNDHSERGPKKVCFVTSNGAGMGHLTRLLAVARRLDSDIVPNFISLSQACGVVSEYGYDFEYIPSKGDLKVDGPEWNKFFNKKFIEALDRARPDVVVFDGTWPYQGVSKAVTSYPAEFVWMRRGMWRKEISSTSMVRNPNFYAVIAPGDVAETYDQGPTQRAIDGIKVEPIVVMDESELLPRNQAREIFGLTETANVMLITLGAGNINKIDDDVAEIIQSVRNLDDHWEILITSPLISNNAHQNPDVRSISIYPLAKYAKAFDFVVSATGYNSYHEWLAYKVPTLWIPNLKTITDDQISRAMFAHDNGLGFAVAPESSMGIEAAVKRLADPVTRESIRAKMNKFAFDNGAYKAAKYISNIAKEVQG